MNTGWVWESTKPGRTILPLQSISSSGSRFARRSSWSATSSVEPDGDNLVSVDEHCPIGDDAEVAHLWTAAWGVVSAQGEELRCVGEECGHWRVQEYRSRGIFARGG